MFSIKGRQTQPYILLLSKQNMEYTMKYYSAFKMNEVPKQATRLNTLYEMSQIQKKIYYITSVMRCIGLSNCRNREKNDGWQQPGPWCRLSECPMSIEFQVEIARGEYHTVWMH